jgi:hypothetical protein
MREAGLRYLRTGEHYILWIKVRNDTSWHQLMQLDQLNFALDSTIVVGKFFVNTSPDTITNALVTIQPPNQPAYTFDYPILEADHFNYDASRKTTISQLSSKNILGDYSALQGGLVFTSKMADTLAYTREFYLMNYTNSSQTPSLDSLPAPPKGWDYAVWAIDTAFTPHQAFLYGIFTSAYGHDKDSANDYYPYPGGAKSQQMNITGGSIIVTLEPRFYGDNLKFMGPSPFTLLNFNRIQFIKKNKNYPMTNISSEGIPNGEIIFYKY